MGLHQYLIVKISPDMKNYTYWVVDPTLQRQQFTADGVPIEGLNGISNRTTSKSTLGTNIQNEMPTLGT